MAGLIINPYAAPIAWVPSLTVGGTGVTDDATLSGFTIVDKYLSPVFLAAGSRARLTVRAAAAAGATLNDIFIGKPAASGSLWNFDGNQVRVTFNGSNSLSLAAGIDYSSDPISFPITIGTGGTVVLLAYNIGLTSTIRRMSGLSTTNYLTYRKAAVQEAALTTKGLSYTSLSGSTYLTAKIEVAP